MGSINEKNRVRKSRDTAPLRTTRTVKNLKQSPVVVVPFTLELLGTKTGNSATKE